MPEQIAVNKPEFIRRIALESTEVGSHVHNGRNDEGV
jgi:hypothetical protein